MKNFGNSSRGRSQKVPKFCRAPTYRAHCAVIFAIAQLSHEVPHWLYISKFTRLRAVSRRQHGSCSIVNNFVFILFQRKIPQWGHDSHPGPRVACLQETGSLFSTCAYFKYFCRTMLRRAQKAYYHSVSSVRPSVVYSVAYNDEA